MTRAAIANTSTYIQGSVDYSAYVSGSNIIVDVTFQMRRTNSYSGDTYGSSSTPGIMISGSQTWNYTGSPGITVRGGQQNVWQTIYSASRTYSASSGGSTIYIGWRVTNDNSGYLGGSATTSITLPQVYTSPSGLTVAISEVYQNGAKFNVSLSSYGNPSSATGRYIEAGILGSNSYGAPYKYQIASNTSSSAITITDTSYHGGTLSIQPNSFYYYGGYADNTQKHISQVTSSFVTLPPNPTFSVNTVTDTTVIINYSLPADGGYYAKNLQYSIDSGSTWRTAVTINTGSATTGTFTITGLAEDTNYTLNTRVLTSAGSTVGNTITFKTAIFGKLYGSINNKTKRITKMYGSVNGKTKKITKIYGSLNGKTKRIF